MDTTFEGNSLMWRAIDSPVIHHIAYIGIYFCSPKGFFAALAPIGAVKLFRLRGVKMAVALHPSAQLGFRRLRPRIHHLVLRVHRDRLRMVRDVAVVHLETEDTAMGISTLWAGFAVLLALNEGHFAYSLRLDADRTPLLNRCSSINPSNLPSSLRNIEETYLLHTRFILQVNHI